MISGVDPQQTFLRLLEPEDLDPSFLEKARRYRVRGVTAMVRLALSGLPNFTAAAGDPLTLRGRLLIAPDLEYLERAFDAAKYGSVSPRPWIEMSIPSVLDPSLAPDGQHAASIYVHFAPRHPQGASWADERDALYRSVIDVLSRHAPAIATLVLERDIITPEDLEQQWGLSGGHIFHGETTLDQWWMTRPFLGWSRYRTPVAGLYLCGAGTHPGAGITGGSGYLAAQAVMSDLKRRL